MGYNKEIPANIIHACKENHADVAKWAMQEFYDGWQAAEADKGVRWLAMWFEWHSCGSIYADGYLACCDYLNGIEEPP